jgi:hypothetical protein
MADPLGFTKPVGTDQVSVANHITGNLDKIDEQFDKGADTASATSVTVPSDAFFHITGTTTTAGFSTVNAGIRKFTRFAGALQLTHHSSSFILIGGANITTAANDVAGWISEGSGNWRMLFYSRAAGGEGVTLTGTQTLTNKTLTSPTLTTPTLANYSNAAHDHGDSDDGGVLVAAAIAGIVGPAALDTGTFPTCRIYNDANISISNNSETSVTFNSERQDIGTMHDPSSNPSRITPGTAGVYLFIGHIEFANNGTGQRYIEIKINGSTVITRQNEGAPDSSNAAQLTAVARHEMDDDDYAELRVYQNSGGSLNISTANNFGIEFEAVYLGPATS